MLVIRGAYIRGGLYSGGAYIRDFTVFKKLISGVTFESIPFSKLFGVTILSSPLPDPEKFDSKKFLPCL